MKNFDVKAIVEIPLGSLFKYEFDKETKSLKLDRPLPAPISYNYGYILETLHDDGDPTDVCIINNCPIYPLTSVTVSILGAFKCTDNGVSDDKLVGIVLGEIRSQDWIEENLKRVEYYLSTYKKGFIVNKWVDVDEAFKILVVDQYRYRGL